MKINCLNLNFIRVGDTELSPKNVKRMIDSIKAIHDIVLIRDRFNKDGYLFFKGLLSRGKILLSKEILINKLVKLNRIDTSFPRRENCILGTFGYGFFYDFKLQSRKIFKKVLESSRIFNFFTNFFQTSPKTYSYKWLRAVATKEYTGAHCDCVYMGCGSRHLLTVWIPLSDIEIEQGTLIINPGSQKYKSLHSYQNLNVDRDTPNDVEATGHLTTNPISWKTKNNLKLSCFFDSASIPIKHKANWVTENMKAGDVVILGIYTIHMSTTNKTKQFRLSCDTRWQPSNEPCDPRWKGKNPSGGEKNRFFIGDKPKEFKLIL